MTSTRIAGIGHYVPENRITNADLEKLMDTTDAWIQERTGIRERRYANVPEQSTSWMGAQAATMALAHAGLSAADVDCIIFATLSSEYFFPGCACTIQNHLDFKSNLAAYDIRMQCSGFVYGLQMADAFIKTGFYRTILLVGAELQSTSLNKTTAGRDVAVIFGDGAGAVVLTGTQEAGTGILSHSMHSEGKYAKELWCYGPTPLEPVRVTHEMVDSGIHFPQMNGRYVFKHAVTRFPEVLKESLDKIGKTVTDLDWFIPHQANLRITEAVGSSLGISPEKVVSNIQKYGNTTAASIPLAMSELVHAGTIQRGDLIGLAAFGAGFTWGSVIIRY
ncbi:MAG: ketoacyl-ACP synthase III [Bacteroidetes bacterium]|nr:ketoacyl-ACP synthase III [Bacteroidota bacterium]